MELKLFLVGLKIQWRAITRSSWKIIGLIGSILMLLAGVMYGFVFAQVLNHPEQLPASLPENIRDIFLTAIVGGISLVFVMRNFVPSVKEKINVIPRLAPVSPLRSVVANLILDITKPVFLGLFVFLATFSIVLNTLSQIEAVYLWGSFVSFWLFSHSMLTLIHHRLNSPILYGPILLYMLPFIIPNWDSITDDSTVIISGMVLFSIMYVVLLEYFSEVKYRENSVVRTSDVNKMLTALSIKEKKMRTLTLIGSVIKLALAAFVFLMQKKASVGEELGIMVPIYEVFLLSPIIVANYFLANLWGMNTGLWLRLNEAGADLRTYFSVYWKVSKIPFFVEFVLGLALYFAISIPVSMIDIGLAIFVFPMLLITSFLGSLWFPKKIDKVMSMAQGSSVPLPVSLSIFATIAIVFMIRVDALFVLGIAALLWIQWELWKRTKSSYHKRSPVIFQKLR